MVTKCEIRPHARLKVMTMGVVDDGMELETYEYIDAVNANDWTLDTCINLARCSEQCAE